MPSPFPGMDPYLERPAIWPGLHQLLIARALADLNAALPDRYVASMNERVYVVQSERDIYPDVAVIERPGPASRAAAVLDVEIDPPLVLTLDPVRMRESYIEIVPVAEPGRVVTIIEVLSPANKTAGPGHELYLEKQREALLSHSSLLEIDLLRAGRHTVAVPRDLLEARESREAYCACLTRGGRPDRFEVWPIPLRGRLPRVAVPLGEGGEPDVALDLQSLLDRAYDEGAFGRRIDYQGDPVPPLSREDAEWARGLIAARRGGR